MPRLCERLAQPSKQANSLPASTGQDSCRRAVKIVDTDHLPVLRPALGADSPSYLRMVKLRELMVRSPVPDHRTAKVVDLFL